MSENNFNNEEGRQSEDEARQEADLVTEQLKQQFPEQEGRFTEEQYETTVEGLERKAAKEKYEAKLRELLNYKNPKAEVYAALIKQIEESESTIETTDEWYHTGYLEGLDNFMSHSEHLAYLKEKLKGTKLLDLGGTMIVTGPLLRQIGLDSYMAINRYGFSSSKESNPYAVVGIFEKELEPNGQFNLPDRVNVKSDMLDFTSRLRSESDVNVMINGIDTIIIKDNKYHQLLAEEITRSLKTGLLVFGTRSTSLNILAENGKFKIIDTDGNDTYILEKI
jgi:hypothetical protein